jgi:tellurite resistance protein TerC
VFAVDRAARFVAIDVEPWAWVLLLVLLVALLGIDLYRHREDHAPTPREAAIESAVWVAIGLSFAGFVWAMWGREAFAEYIAGYLIEKSLSVDNVFVWSMLFTTFAIPLKYQHRVLFWGIFGALALRAGFIGLGAALIASFWWMLLLFGAFLIYTGIKVIRHRDDEHDDVAQPGTKLLAKVMPVSNEFDGHKFTTRLNGRRAATPLLAALIAIELSDVIFAVDSVPAILAISRETYLVFASNAFAILGLRAMYFLLANAKEQFHYLSHALGAILIFVGVKMVVGHWFHINTYLSLGVIAVILTAAIIGSRVVAKP